jgi:hypothetical protein
MSRTVFSGGRYFFKFPQILSIIGLEPMTQNFHAGQSLGGRVTPCHGERVGSATHCPVDERIDMHNVMRYKLT